MQLGPVSEPWPKRGSDYEDKIRCRLAHPGGPGLGKMSLLYSFKLVALVWAREEKGKCMMHRDMLNHVCLERFHKV